MGDADLMKKYKEVCADLNLDRAAADEAWQSMQRIRINYTLEGEPLHWLACALYVSCRRGKTPTVGGKPIDGNCVSLTRLLRCCSLSLVQFFSKMKKWSDMANLPHEMRERVDHLERNFSVTTVIFLKYKPIFEQIFKSPIISPLKPKSRKQSKKITVTSSEVFSFCWTLFVYVKSKYSAISDDLVNSYHLLLACIDFCYANALVADNNTDLLNPLFAELPADFQSGAQRNSDTVACIIKALCTKYDGIFVDAAGIKEHWWRPAIKRMVEMKQLKCRPATMPSLLLGFLDAVNFEFNLKNANKDYDQYVLNYGDFDERIFLCENADEELGTRDANATDALSEQMIAKQRNSLKQHMDEVTLTPSTPLSNRHYLKNRDDAFPITPVSSATQTVSQLHSLLLDRKDQPSQSLLDIFAECTENPKNAITKLITEMGEKFVSAYSQPMDQEMAAGDGKALSIHSNDFANKRLELTVTLYYKMLENIVKHEKGNRPVASAASEKIERQSKVLNTDLLHVSLFACCAEIVLYSYNSKRTYPWIIHVFSDFKKLKFQPFYFYRVIELIIRDEDGLSRSVVKHLNLIEEQILESDAWKEESQLWDCIRDQGVPSCQDVALPTTANGVPPSPLSRRLARNDPFASPVPSAASDRFASPIHNSAAKRRLFSTETGPGTAAAAAASGATPNGNEQQIVHISTQTSTGEVRMIPVYAYVLPSADARSEAPKKAGSIGLFFRKFYNLAWIRTRDLCDRLHIESEDLRRKIWTCFEDSIKNHSVLMRNRHLDQLFMCSIYAMCKVARKQNDREISFTEIMKCYREQPQAASHIYRSVLLSSRNTSTSSDSGNSSENGSHSPTEEKEVIRSSSTLPVSAPSSQPPTPTRMSGTGSQFEFGEVRGDLIKFYNEVYVPEVKSYIISFQETNESPLLSPLPRLAANLQSPCRRVSQKHPVFVSPLKTTNFPQSPNRPICYSFMRSPAKDLHAINQMMKRNTDKKTVSKRIFQDDGDSESSKKLCTEPQLIRSKIQNIFSERGSSAADPQIFYPNP